MQKQYDPHSIEGHWYRTWEQRGYFRADTGGTSADSFCIMIPPPNVTGTLHMGHAFQDTLMDILVRLHRMQGDATLWQPGTDHAGIATQMVVERQLAAEGLSRHDIGREAFVERVWRWKQESGNQIGRQLRRLGASCDWSRERFTMDEGLSEAVIEVFVRLYDEGLIYRGKRLVNWDPVLHTAISDLEVVSGEEQGKLWHLRYPLADAAGHPTEQHLVVATTRPETMLGDSAVAVHPDDERYRHLIGRRVWLPLAQRLIPVIGDDYVDPAFGSGCVKITPAHDFNDYLVGQRHDLPVINIFTPDAAINDQAPAQFRGLDRFVARQKVSEELKAAGLLEKIEEHRLMVPRGDRSGAVLEPYLTDQWFVDLTRETQDDGRPGGRRAIVQPAVEAVRKGRIEFVPDNWSKIYFQWLENIQDWCISRQLWWGHRIPAWYDEENNIYVGRDENEVRRRHRLGGEIRLRRDEDVLDTWFSSALWPFSTLGWPEQTAELDRFYPTSTLVTGFDIIFFWVARMVMMGIKFTGEVPFREVYIHGLVRDSEGQKMSKSKGNVLDPIDLIDGIDIEGLIDKRTRGLMQPQMAERIAAQTRRHFPDGIPSYGADALRFTFAALATHGRDINFDLGRVEGYRNFCNKLWNAARYVLLSGDRPAPEPAKGEAAALSVADRWIVSRLQRTEKAVLDAVGAYRFDLAAQALYEFTWDEYCDWYLELSKPLLQSEAVDPATKRATQLTLVRVLEALLRLAHPFMPFITEEIWQRISPLAGRHGETIMRQPYPVPDSDRIDPSAEGEIEWLKGMILAIRRIRGEMNLSPHQALPVALQNVNAEDRERLNRHKLLINRVARVESMEILEAGHPAPEAATALLGEMTILVPLAGLIDVQAELRRLDKELARLNKEHQRIASKLANPKFLENAPAAVVEKERRRDREVRRAIKEFSDQRQRIAAL